MTKKRMKELDPALVALGDEIRRRRRDLGFSQTGFAHEMHMAHKYYGGVERGERKVSISNLMRIAIGLNTSLTELLKNVDQKFVVKFLKKR